MIRLYGTRLCNKDIISNFIHCYDEYYKHIFWEYNSFSKCLVFGGLVKLVKTGALQASGRSSNLLLITNRQTSALNLAGSASEPWLRSRMLLYSIA